MKYDVIIAGGGTAGCAAAYILGKANKNILIIEKNSYLGGSMTSALVTPMMKTSDNSINNEFLNLFLQKMRKYNAAITYPDGNSGWFNPEIAKIVLDEMMSEANVKIFYNSEISRLNISDRNIKSIEIDDKILSVPIETRYIVDSTGNCDVGNLANCKFINKNNEKQPTNLRFIMGGIDLIKYSDWLLKLDTDRNVTTSYDVGGQRHLSTAYTWDKGAKWALAGLFDDAVAKHILKDEDRNYFQVFSIPGMPGSLAFNCPRVYFNQEID